MVGSGRMGSDPEDYERAFWSRRLVHKFRKARRGLFPGCHSVPLQTEETEPQKQNPSTKERSSTELRFASFPRAIVRGLERRSRVEMNALAGALDRLPRPNRRCVQILLLTRTMT